MREGTHLMIIALGDTLLSPRAFREVVEISLGMKTSSPEIQAYFNEYRPKKIGWLLRRRIGMKPDEIGYFSKNPTAMVLEKLFIYPSLNPKLGSQFMFGTTCFTFFRNQRLVRIVVQCFGSQVVERLFFQRWKKDFNELFGSGVDLGRGIIWQGKNITVNTTCPEHLRPYFSDKTSDGINIPCENIVVAIEIAERSDKCWIILEEKKEYGNSGNTLQRRTSNT